MDNQSNKSLWNKSNIFVLAMIGAVLGLTSLTQFSYLMYENGGGTFFIPYVIAMVLIGVPFLSLEFGAGLKFKSSLAKLLFNIKNDYEYLAWFLIFLMFLLLSIYITIMGWDFIYLLLSLFKGWGVNPNVFFSQTLLHSSSNLYALTYLVVPIGMAVILVWGIIYFISKRGIDKISKFYMVLTPTILALFILLFVLVFSLNGSKLTMLLILRPDWSFILDYHIWLAGFTQVISALLIGQAISSSFASYLDNEGESKLRLVDNAWIISLVSFGFQVIFTLIIFGLLGAMIKINSTINISFTDCFNLLFILIPNVFNTIGFWGNILGFIFYLVLFIAGLTTAIAIIEPFVSSLVEKFSLSREKSLRYICLVGIIISLLFTTGMGEYLIKVISNFLMKFAILLAILLEVVIIGWVYGADRLMNTLNNDSFIKVDKFWIISIKFIIPIVLIILLVFGIYDLILTGDSKTLFIDSIVAVIFVIVPLVLTLNLINNDYFDLDLNLDLHIPGSSKKPSFKDNAEFSEDGSFINPYKNKKDKRNGKNVLFNVDLSSSAFDSPNEKTLDDFGNEEDIRDKSVFGKINRFNKDKENKDSLKDEYSVDDSSKNTSFEGDYINIDENGIDEFSSRDSSKEFSRGSSKDSKDIGIDDGEEKKSKFSLFKGFKNSKLLSRKYNKEGNLENSYQEDSNDLEVNSFISEEKNSSLNSKSRWDSFKDRNSSSKDRNSSFKTRNSSSKDKTSSSKSDFNLESNSSSSFKSSLSSNSSSKPNLYPKNKKSRFKKAADFEFDELYSNRGNNKISKKEFSENMNIDDNEEKINISKLQSDYYKSINDEVEDDFLESTTPPRLEPKSNKSNSGSGGSGSGGSGSSSDSSNSKSEDITLEDQFEEFTEDFFDDGVFGDEGYESLLDDYEKQNKTKSKSKPKSKAPLEPGVNGYDYELNKSKSLKPKARAKINKSKGKPKTITISSEDFDEDKYYDVEDKGADSVFNLDE